MSTSLDELPYSKEEFQENLTVEVQDKQNIGILGRLRNEISEENLLVLLFLYISNLDISNEMTLKIIPLPTNVSINYLNIIKCVLLLGIFILFKLFILPLLQL